MASRAKRLTFTIGGLALVAVIVGGVLAPGPAAAAKKPTDPNAYVITAVLDQGLYGNWGGSFRAEGAIDDRGSAGICGIDPDLLLLYGEHGNMKIRLEAPTFWEYTIEEATGDYAGLVGLGGTYMLSANHKKDGKPPKWEDQAARAAPQPATSTYTTLTYTLEGSVAQ